MAGFYGNSATMTCVACTNNCETCSSETLCLSCILNYFLSGNVCGTTCVSPLYRNYVKKVCVDAVDEGEYVDSSGNIQKCD